MPLTRKSLLVHQGRQSDDVLIGFLESLAKSAPKWRVNATVPVPSYQPETAREKLERFDTLAKLVIADPQAHRVEFPYANRGRAREHYDYLACSDPHDKVEEFVEQVLSVQVALGRKYILSPALRHGAVPGQKNLRATRRFAHAAAESAHLKGKRLLVGAHVTEAVIADSDARNDWLDELVDWPDGPVVLSCWMTPPDSFKQYSRRDPLVGLRATVDSLAQNDRPVVLPQTGLFGWLMLAFGAQTFGSGIDSSMMCLAVRPGGGGGAERLKWYFLPQFLGFVLADEARKIGELKDYEKCPCPYCGGLPLGQSGSWDFNRAGLHYLWWCGRLASEADQAAVPLTAVRNRIDAAREFWRVVQAAKVVLDPRSVPNHLAVWSEVVA